MLQNYVQILQLQTSPDQFFNVFDKAKYCIAALNHIRCTANRFSISIFKVLPYLFIYYINILKNSSLRVKEEKESASSRIKSSERILRNILLAMTRLLHTK